MIVELQKKTKMKKVLCLIDTLGMGGAERQMIGLAVLLRDKGYEVDLVTYYPHNFHHELISRYGMGTLTLHTGDSKLSKLITIARHIRKTGDYNWIIAYKDGPAVIGCLLRMIRKDIRLIVSERSTNQTLTIKDKIKFFLYRWADYVVPNSYSQEKFIKEKFPLLAGKISTITNFTDTKYFSAIDDTSTTEKLRVMTAARITIAKNLPNYLKAIQLLKRDGYAEKVHFVWYGDIQIGEESYGEDCLKLVKSLSIDDMIDIYPATTDIVSHYHTADIFCLPSIFEGFPNALCEAMSCGKPIVCSEVCDNPSIVRKGVNALLFNPKDCRSIYSELKKMIDMPKSVLVEWGMASRKIAEIDFSMESFVDKYINLIESK